MGYIILNNDLDGISFSIDEEGNWGYIPSGADTVIPFKKSKTSFTIQIRFILHGDHYSSEKGFVYDNTGNNKYSTLSYTYTGSCACKIYGDGTSIKSISAPGWSSQKTGTIDISSYSEIDARGISNGTAISGNLTITFS